LFEESARAVIAPPWVFLARLGYVGNLGRDDFLKVGVLGELISVPERKMLTWRLGPIATARISDHFDALLALTMVVAGRDTLGPTLGAFGIAGIRYKWASGEATPSFP